MKHLLRRKPSSSRMTWALRLRLSWTRWSLTRLQKRQLREEKRLALMLRQQDSQLLLLKELEERQWQASRRLEEMEGSRLYREQEALPALQLPELLPVSNQQLMNQLLGLEQPTTQMSRSPSEN